jgi:hypothetical protein
MAAYLNHPVAAGPARDCSQPTPALALAPQQRRDLATDVLAGKQSASQAARDHCVSRKFVARQTAKAREALDQAFTPSADDAAVLFHLPVTKAWIRQATLGLALTCHSSLRGITQFFGDHFDHSLALGTIHNILKGTVARAREHNATADLSRVDIAALDEIFQAGQPVLVGADAASTYCFLLSQEQHRDADTWAVRLLELVDRGLAPEAAIADFASGLRAGLAQALPGVPCRGDVFHVLMGLNAVVRTLDNRADRAIDDHDRRQRQRARADRDGAWGGEKVSLTHRRVKAQEAEAAAIARADDVRTLLDWLRRDVLAVAGPDLDGRRHLYDFIVAELQPRLHNAGTACQSILSVLARHRDDLLAFAEHLVRQRTDLANQLQVDPALLRDLLAQRDANPHRPDYWQREAQLHRRAGGRLHQLRQAVERLGRRTVRASSVIENLNSRLRSYFFLRRHLGADYLELLRFYLNHRPFLRSDRPERIGQSPRQLLTGEPHPHWLELLGHQRFVRH